MILPGVFCPQYLPMYGPTVDRKRGWGGGGGSTDIVPWVRLGLTQYLFVCHSRVTQGFNYHLPPPHGGVKTSVSVRYVTGPIKTLEKRLQTFHACLLFRTQKKSKAEEEPVVRVSHGFCLFAGCKLLSLPVLSFFSSQTGGGHSHGRVRFVDTKQVKKG